MRVLKIECPECHDQALIRRNNRKHPHLYDIYCACKNMDCGHRFVMNLTFSHTLSLSQRESMLSLLQNQHVG